MPRTVSTDLANLLALDTIEPHSTLVLTLTDGSIQRFATSQLTIGGNSYSPRIKRVGDLKQSLTDSIDRVSVSLRNEDNFFGIGTSTKTSLYTGAAAIYSRYYVDPRGILPAVHRALFQGEIVRPTILNQKIKERLFIREFRFELVSDIVAAGYCVSARTMTQREGFKYPYPRQNSVPGTGGNEGGGGSGWGCFAGDTLIRMGDGSEKRIDEIKTGDEVLAFDENTMEIASKAVTEVFEHEDCTEYFVFDYGRRLVVTPEHLIFDAEAKRLFRAASTFNLSHSFAIYENGSWQSAQITRAKWCAGRNPQAVYNLEVADFHTFFAGGVAVHNNKEVGI